MGARTSVGLAFLVLLAACARQGGVEPQAPEPISREKGPGAYIYADYWGGLVTRTVDVSFGVDQTAFVLVAHLGGDGVIRVVYPQSPGFGQFVEPLRPRQTIRTTPFIAYYDGAPSLYTFRMTPLRSTGAKWASYDGAGHGFIFIIASRAPLRYDMIFDGYEWLEFSVPDYDQTTDPRLAIQQYANALAPGGRYTLKFATQLTTQGYASYASRAMDCATLSTLGLNHLQNFWSSWAFGMPSDLWGAEFQSRLGFGRGGCGPLHYASLNRVFDPVGGRRGGILGFDRPYRPITPTIAKPDPYTPVRNRPTYRPFSDRRTTVTQSAMSSTPRTYTPIQRPSDRGGSFTRGPSTTSGTVDRGSFTRGPSTSSGTVDRGGHRAPVSTPAAAPRVSSPSSSPSSSRPSPASSSTSTPSTSTSPPTTKQN